VSLRAKTLFIVLITWAGLTALLYLTADLVLFRSFRALEEREARHALERALAVFDGDVQGLDELAADHAVRPPDVAGGSTTASYLVFPESRRQRLRLDVLAVFDRGGRQLRGWTREAASGPPRSGRGGLPGQLESSHPLLEPLRTGRGRTGALLLGGEPLLVAARPLGTGDPDASAAGVLVLGRFLDEAYGSWLSERARLPLALTPAPDAEMPAGPPAGALAWDRPLTDVRWTAEGTLGAGALYPDLQGNPAFLLRTELPPLLASQRRRVGLYVLSSAALGGLLFAGVTFLLLERVVLLRLKELGGSLALIAEQGRPDERVPVRGADELAQLASVVNRTLEALQRSQEGLRKSEERYDLAIRGVNDGVWDWDLVSDQVYFSPRFVGMLGLEPAEVSPRPVEWLERLHPDDLAVFQAKLTALRRGLEGNLEHEYRIRHKDGAYRWMLCRGVVVRDAEGRLVRLVGSQTDIAARKAVEDRLLREALYDALTGLPNRSLLMDRLRQAIARAKRRPDLRCAVLFIDLDRFKVVNDSLGHMEGDRLLATVARRLEACVRPGDSVARLGGDEFVVLVEGVRDPEDVSRTAERILREMRMPLWLGEHEVFPTASIGIALSSSERDSPEELLRDADTAMYQAKARGRARHEVFHSAMHARAMAILQLENDLQRAMEREEFEVHYQPVVSLASGRIAGFEALARWRSPARGLVLPGDFVPLAEETGLIVAVGERVLREACRQARAWVAAHPDHDLSIKVNVSGRQLVQPGLVEDVQDILRESGLDPRRLELEITESVLFDKVEVASGILSRLKALDLCLAVDDFGTGYSSLSTLHHFPVDTIKIDGSFIAPLDTSPKNRDIVQAIMTLAQSLGFAVVAEGVEREAQLQELRAMRCGFGQGYYFGAAVPAAQAGELLARSPRFSIPPVPA
jgi:diguanylate cyclase (GGDEF)-like protein/PAS domain S-box-containing protein